MLDNHCGFTLTEFLAAIVVLMVGMLGLLTSVNLAMDKNLETVYRSEAALLADEQLLQLKSRPYECISTTVASPPMRLVERNIHGFFKNYSVQSIVTQPTTQSKEIVINVKWRKKNTDYAHSISSIVSTN